MKQRSRRVLIGLVVLVAVAGAAFVVSRSGQDVDVETTAVLPTIPAETGADGSTTGASPATATAAGEEDEEPDPAAESPALDTERPTEADLVVTYSGFDVATGAVLVGAYVAGLLEDGGECGLTLSDGTTERTATVEAVPDARTTSCGELTLPEMRPGSWSGEVTYTAADGDTLSRDVEVEVP
ncbi:MULTISPECIES: hypothetical protein [unclassified Geodermatophilus]|uniref:hypothetical protein n=1 Tax=unclassified Geodermatophilus TaxID=2637632 RepID=UPI003EEDB817